MHDLLSIPQAAEILQLSRARVHILVQLGRLPSTRVGERYLLLSREDVERFAAVPRPAGRSRKALEPIPGDE